MPNRTERKKKKVNVPDQLVLSRKLQGPLEKPIQIPLSPKQQATYNLVERQRKTGEEIKWRVGVHHAKCIKHFISCKTTVHVQHGYLVCARAHAPCKTSKKFSTKLAHKWEVAATVSKKLGPVKHRLGWHNSSEKQDSLNVINLIRCYGILLQKPSAGRGSLYGTVTYEVRK